MPRRDGTGPFGTGPLNNSGRRAGRGSGRRQGLNQQPGCKGDGGGGQRNVSSPRLSGIQTGNILGAAAKLLSMAAMAIPALLKARRQLQLPEEGGPSGTDGTGQPVIEIEAESVEEPDTVKKT